MSRRRCPGSHTAGRLVLAAALGSVAGVTDGLAQGLLPNGFFDQQMVAALDDPVGMAFLPDGRLLVIEQKTASVKLVIPGAITTTTPIFTVPEVNASGGEQGLLGIAIDPDWPARSFVYLLYDHAGDSRMRLSRYLVTGDLDFSSGGDLAISPASRYDVLIDAPDDASNHNGGTLRFGPDRMLHASLGEDANRCAAQDSVSLRGVILRLDVSRLPTVPGGPAPKALIAAAGNPFAAHPDSNARLVWALGLRNPFRFHIDSPTGDLYIADVGERTWEEVDLAAGGGHNFGWPHFEGPAPFGQSCSDNNSGFVAPIHAYDGSAFTASIIGAGPYRRPATGIHRFPPPYDGNYFFNDYYQGFLRRLVYGGGTWSIAPAVPGQPSALDWGTGFRHVSDWVVGPTGALWYCRQSNDAFQAGTGEIRRIVGDPGPAPVIGLVRAVAGEGGRSATIRWSTDVEADSRVDYGIDPGVLDQSAAQTTLVVDHAVFLGGLQPATDYFYRVQSATSLGATSTFPDLKSPPLDFTTPSLPALIQLGAPFPSPAPGSTTLPYALARRAVVTIRLYDSRGRLVRTLVGGEARDAGPGAETWDGRDEDGRAAPAGIYVVRLGVEGDHFERRFALIR